MLKITLDTSDSEKLRIRKVLVDRKYSIIPIEDLRRFKNIEYAIELIDTDKQGAEHLEDIGIEWGLKVHK